MPAAANYHSAPMAHRPRGLRMCDQCGKVEEPGFKFRMCGGCMITQYCSPECQKLNWPGHKAICQHTAATKEAAMASYPDENLVKNLRKFTSMHQDLFSWASFQALQLKRLPANIRQHALLIELAPTNHPDPHRRFAIMGTHLVPRTYVTERDPLVAADIQRREERCRGMGGIGTAIVLLQCGATSQVMPVEVDAPGKIGWEQRNDWAAVMHHFVDSGRTDFLSNLRLY